ncbi:hypothetical protein BDZ97DRAFT_2075580 [Flammula alnicola]|nr:hypothetical protein BDZ97DRAFT_2075580 [Flammula alnicola]
MSSSKKTIPPNPPRWKPNPDPASIVVPGLNTDASTTDQIEQIEQLITIKLQNIDENFSKIHNVLANKLLPALKRYAVGTEPVREAAKFWTSFYEQAAQIRIPTFDDYSTVNETPSEREENESSSHEQATDSSHNQTAPSTRDIYETSTVNSETSFLPGQGAFSSTPAMGRVATSTNDSFGNEHSEEPSWTPSLESPLVRLNREISNFSTQQADNGLVPSTSTGDLKSTQDQDDTTFDSTFQQDASILPRSDKGKGKETSQPLLRNVLRHNMYSASDNSSFESKKVSPLKFRGKPKTPTIDKSFNPYLRPEASPAEWNGVVDLRDPSMLTPQRKGKSAKTKATTTPYADDDDDSFDGLPPGMSPPLLMSPARPPRSSAELGLLKLGQTPARDASARIQRDLLREAQFKSGGDKRGDVRRLYGEGGYYESSMSTVPTPPSLSRYNRRNDYSSSSSITKDSSLESMIRHIRSDIRPDVGATPGMATTPGLRLRPRVQPVIAFNKTAQSQQQAEQQQQRQQQQQPYFPEPPEPATPVYSHMHQQEQLEQEQDIDSDSDSLELDEINNTAHPSAAFLMASQGGHRQYDDDDSFGSSNHSSDSLTDEDVVGAAGIVPVHPFAQAAHVVEDDGFDDDDDDDDDSFDGFETQPAGVGAVGGGYQEETVFGVAPAQRQVRGEGLRMLGEDLLQDTIGIGSQIAASGRVEESPTPASWPR